MRASAPPAPLRSRRAACAGVRSRVVRADTVLIQLSAQRTKMKHRTVEKTYLSISRGYIYLQVHSRFQYTPTVIYLSLEALSCTTYISTSIYGGADLCVTQACAEPQGEVFGRHAHGTAMPLGFRHTPGVRGCRRRAAVGAPWRVRANTSPRTLRSQPAAHDRAREPPHDGLELLDGGRALGVGCLAAADSGATAVVCVFPCS